ncbi:ABC transporter ATP-binding protein [Flammeovirgaceae bacterium SG7u.111]|nr:ABC transporter ATP-binding protein [Flammeovirgaceae bacterium SG7u.132]WPO34964.1 ABC transporter ATP-binding protein [Flammeovirgaceae bacterium SG7u.111]
MPVLKVENLSKQYRLGTVGSKTLRDDMARFWANVRGKEDPTAKIGEVNDRATKGDSDYVWALKDINFEVEQGEILGIIGKNGAGKSTLLKILSKVTGPTTGRIRAKGRIASLLEVGTGFHPELTGRENIYLNGAILGMTRVEITAKLEEIVEFAGVAKYIDTPVKRYSSGMTVRLGFAVAAHLEPEILIVDEVLAVGDAEFQKKAIGKMQDVSKGEGRTVLFVSHNMASVRKLCNRGILLDRGGKTLEDNIDKVISSYLSYGEKALNKTYFSFDKDTSLPIQIRKILLLNNIGHETTLFDYYDNVSLEIHFDINIPSKHYYSVIVLHDNMGNILFTSANDDMKYSELANLRPGSYEYRIKLPSKILRAGDYTVTLSFIDRSTRIKDKKERLISFSIEDTTSYRAINNQYRPTIIAPEIPWHITL